MDTTPNIVISARATGMGARTEIAWAEAGTINAFAVSKTGNHWSETLDGAPISTRFGVRNISNSGKHGCYIAIVTLLGFDVIQENDPYAPYCIVCDTEASNVQSLT